MSGDVFGNGLLLSRKICLKAAFNHQHVFLDPEPDMKKSFQERRRLFRLARSSWTDYKTELISRGGGVFSRQDKTIPLSPEVRAWLGVEEKQMAPNVLIRELLKATGVEVEVLMAFTPAVSGIDTPLYKAIVDYTASHYPDSKVRPAVSTGFTDSHFTRDLGISSYGFNPIIIPDSEFSRIHGNDERVNVANFKRGVTDHLEIVKQVVYD